LIALVLGIAIVVLQYPLGKLGFALIGTAPETLASATAYFNAQIWGAPATLLRFVLVGWFLGQEHSKKVLILSLVGSAANIALDYLLIVQWNWGSMGAGTSYMISQYLVLLIGLIFLCIDIKLSEIQALVPKIWDSSAFRSAFQLNGNLFINSIVLLLVFLIFNYQSVGMGTIIYAGNSLLLQIVTLSLYISDSLKLSLETLGGNFKGKGEKERLPHLVWTAVVISLLVGLISASISVLFPDMVFGLFTNHSEVIDSIVIYVPWLILILVTSSIVYVMIGYFIVLAKGQTIRDSSLISAVLGFAPASITVFWVHSNNVLWLALCLFFTVRIVILGIELPRTFIAENSPDTGVA
jgi:MATE family multidrug resistance protein